MKKDFFLALIYTTIIMAVCCEGSPAEDSEDGESGKKDGDSKNCNLLDKFIPSFSFLSRLPFANPTALIPKFDSGTKILKAITTKPPSSSSSPASSTTTTKTTKTSKKGNNIHPKNRYDNQCPRISFCKLLASFASDLERSGKLSPLTLMTLSMFQKNRRKVHEKLLLETRAFYQNNPYGNRRDFMFLVAGDVRVEGMKKGKNVENDSSFIDSVNDSVIDSTIDSVIDSTINSTIESTIVSTINSTIDSTINSTINSGVLDDHSLNEMERLFHVFENEDPIGAIIKYDRLDFWKMFLVDLEPLPIHLQMAVLMGRTEIVSFMLGNSRWRSHLKDSLCNQFHLTRLDYIMAREWLEHEDNNPNDDLFNDRKRAKLGFEPYSFLYQLSPLVCLFIGIEWAPYMKDSPMHSQITHISDIEACVSIIFESEILCDRQLNLLRMLVFGIHASETGSDQSDNEQDSMISSNEEDEDDEDDEEISYFKSLLYPSTVYEYVKVE